MGSIARSVCPAPPPDAFHPAFSGSSNSPPLSKVSSKPFPESTLISFAWTNTSSRKNLRSICDDGKGKLQWEREIPQEALDNLNNLATTDFKANLGKIIHDIYLTGHNMFKDMPQGDHKKRAKYRFA